MARCSACQAPILWTVTEAGKRLPVDAEADDRGVTIALETDDGNVIPTGDTAGAGDSLVPVVYVTGRLIEANQLFPPAHRWRPHFATCPDAERFRRRPKVSAAVDEAPPGPYGRGESIITPRHP